MNSIGEYLKSLRQQSRMPVSTVARAAGISSPYLYQIEDGRRNPSARVLTRLASVYGVRPEDLLIRANVLPAPEGASGEAPAPEESREDRIRRAFEYVMRDPAVKAGSDAMSRLPEEAKVAIIRLYERAEGLRILPDDFF